ncbi:DNA-3-methyladenine glycosylase I [Vibrio ulleungensis]|uniref:DNA-3-methyladenine glycosylase I n=1 Tax=Vibrio ulleungensis TaxID=2807619 RepID=UPI001F17452C|nr:DNA-3-methyladenine glycosylase I [Vibrio ulleungensis]
MSEDSKAIGRCKWVDVSKPDYVAYHDNEWGVPVYDDRVFFEFITLEGAQAGLNWYTILKRRQGYRDAFADFDVHKVANFDQDKIDALLLDEGIIRHRLKVASTVTNAQAFIAIQQEFGSFSQYVWAFVGNEPVINRLKPGEYPPATTELSDALSKDLKKRGFKFVGSTIIYAFMQACGLVVDHNSDCHCCGALVKQGDKFIASYKE